MTGGGFSGASRAPVRFFSFSDGTRTRIRSDFNRVRSDMYTEYRLVTFQDWAHTYNMKLRLQQEDGPYTSIADQLQTSAVLDRSEYESLTGSDQADIYRPMASANHMTGNTWFSTECCAVLNESYVETVQDAIIRMNNEFAGGVNRIVYHILPYLDTPAIDLAGFGLLDGSKVSFSNAWNRTEPYWIDAAAMNDYFARSRKVLTQGAGQDRRRRLPAQLLVAGRLRDRRTRATATGRTLGLQQAGYTWDYLDEVLFDLPNAVVTNRQLAANGPGYKALIFDQFLYPTTNTARGSAHHRGGQQDPRVRQGRVSRSSSSACPPGPAACRRQDADLQAIVAQDPQPARTSRRCERGRRSGQAGQARRRPRRQAGRTQHPAQRSSLRRRHEDRLLLALQPGCRPAQCVHVRVRQEPVQPLRGAAGTCTATATTPAWPPATRSRPW